MLYNIPNLNLPCRLTSKQLADLITGPQMHGFEPEMWTGKMRVEHVRRKYNIGYVPHTIQRLMHDMRFSYVKPRPRHPKSASNKEKKTFEKIIDFLMPCIVAGEYNYP